MSADEVQADVLRLVSATFVGDIDTVMALTHPQVLNALGDGARDMLAQALSAMAAMQLKLVRVDFPEPPEFFAGNENEFVVVPIAPTILLSGEEHTTPTFQLGARKAGEPWRYVEGGRLDVDSLLGYFPDFPEDRISR